MARNSIFGKDTLHVHRPYFWLPIMTNSLDTIIPVFGSSMQGPFSVKAVLKL